MSHRLDAPPTGRDSLAGQFKGHVMIRGYVNAMALAGAMLAASAPVSAGTAVYDIAGMGEARIFSYVFDYSTGEYVEPFTSLYIGDGAFTASFRVDTANLPPNMPSASGTINYVSSGGVPTFLRSQSSAFIGGQEFGFSSSGGIYNLVADPYGPGTGYILIDVATRADSSNPMRTYYDSGAVKSEATFESYNQFYSFGGSTVTIDGVLLPDFPSGGSIQAIYTLGVQQFSEDGNRGRFSYISRQYLGNGSATLSLVDAGVPEPASWALMIAGFGLIGHGLRRRRAATVAC